MSENINPEFAAEADRSGADKGAVSVAPAGDGSAQRKGSRKNAARLLTLFWVMLRISAVTLGGGWAIVAIMEREFCEKRGWLDRREMLGYTAIAQSSTGSIAINAAMLVGRGVAGWAGAAAAVLGSALPPLVGMTLLAYFYGSVNPDAAILRCILLGMQAATAAVIMDAAITMVGTVFKKDRLFAVIITAATFALTVFTELNSAFVITGAALAGIIRAAARAKVKR